MGKNEISEKREIIKGELKKTLKRPVTVRWNSFHDAVLDITEVENKIPGLCKKLGITNVLTKNDFTYLNHYLKYTKDISEAITVLEGDVHYGYLLPTLLNFRKNLLTLVEEYSVSNTK